MYDNFIFELNGNYWDCMLEVVFDAGMIPEFDTVSLICMR